MVGEHSKFQARRVIAGVDDKGRSTVVADEITPQRATAAAFTICDIWETESLPIPMDAAAVVGEVSIYPPKAGFTFRVCAFPPDSEYDKKTAYEASLAALKGRDAFRAESEIPGMHVTDSLDIVTVVSGELHVVLETGETLLRQGDSLVVRGVMRCWSNKTDKPVIITSLIMSALRPQ
jgi:hypothetical protein